MIILCVCFDVYCLYCMWDVWDGVGLLDDKWLEEEEEEEVLMVLLIHSCPFLL